MIGTPSRRSPDASVAETQISEAQPWRHRQPAARRRRRRVLLVLAALLMGFGCGFVRGWLTHLQHIGDELRAIAAAKAALAQQQALLANRRLLQPPAHGWWWWWLQLGWHHLVSGGQG